mmetsp:Transcript_10735/g.32004  ORF Transcript_10735/g.32004 Transcript_10735/m.32004 type:complete len:366 (-) Transcript_10735:35-1132(-)
MRRCAALLLCCSLWRCAARGSVRNPALDYPPDLEEPGDWRALWQLAGGSDAEWASMGRYERSSTMVEYKTRLDQLRRDYAAPARARRVFVIVTVQRTGSTWLSERLQQHPCIECAKEVFLDQKGQYGFNAPFHYEGHMELEALESLANMRVPANATPANSSYVFQKLRRLCLQDRRNGQVKACGFKWMLSQHIDVYWDEWLRPLAKRYGIRFVFLKRDNYLRTLASAVAKAYETAKNAGHTNQKSAAATGHYLQLKEGQALLDELAQYERDYAFMERMRQECKADGLKTRDLTYENLVLSQNASALASLADFILTSTHCRVHDFRYQQTDSQRVHAGALADYVANWEAVEATLRGTRFEKFLTMD